MFWKKKPAKKKALEVTGPTFNELVLNTKEPILLDFWAAHCGPCRVIGPIIDELAADFEGRAVVGKVNTQENPHLSAHFKIKSIPTLMIINRGQVMEQFKGLIPKPNLAEILEEYIAANEAADSQMPSSGEEE